MDIGRKAPDPKDRNTPGAKRLTEVGRHHRALSISQRRRNSLRRVECLAACGGGPCMQVGFDYHENLTEAKADAVLEKLK